MKTEKQSVRDVPTVSRSLPDGRLIELVYLPDEQQTRLAEHMDGITLIADSLPLDSGMTLVPVSANNNLIKHRAVLLPGAPLDFGNEEMLRQEIEDHLHRYVDLSDSFRALASAYVLLSWVYDAFNELPYLRLRGDYGSGKTRALLVIGSLCYKGFFASGASTVSPIFHTLDTFRGTLILDEADFRFSDEKSELSKILNNGNVRGFPVLRTAITKTHEFDPRAFSVFGPKIIAMRNCFDDRALESRFITEEMGQRSLRTDIPLNLPDAHDREAQALRSKLLQYRFSKLHQTRLDTSLQKGDVSARVNQILIPLLSITNDKKLHERIREAAGVLERELRATQAATSEGELLEVLHELFETTTEDSISVGDITSHYIARFGKEYTRPITSRYVGFLLRKRLHLIPYKRHGVYVLSLSEKPKIEALCARYGIES
jgi:hypothetical protein